MTSLKIVDADIPSLEGKVALVTGGASGIGLEAVKVLASKGAKAYILDLSSPDDGVPAGSTYIRCDTRSWTDLLKAYKQAQHVDIAIANAGVSEDHDFLEDRFDASGELLEPQHNTIDVNFRGTLNFVKLAISFMRRQGNGGSIVITSSATAYAPEQSLPVYSATKHALIGLLRALRSTLPQSNISINAVAPAATITKLLPRNLAIPLQAAGLPVSSAHFVALAVVYSAIVQQRERVADYGRDEAEIGGQGKWNGRTILTLGEDYTEVEEGIARLRSVWFGEKNERLTRMQQTVTDFRSVEGGERD